MIHVQSIKYRPVDFFFLLHKHLIECQSFISLIRETWMAYYCLRILSMINLELMLNLDYATQSNQFKFNFVIHFNLSPKPHRKIVIISSNGIPSGCITIRFADHAVGECNGHKGNPINAGHMWTGRPGRDATAYPSRLHRIGELQSIVDDVEWIHSKSGSL